MSHRLLLPFLALLGLSACATSRPVASEGWSTAEWVIAAPAARVAEAFAATRDSVGLRPVVADSSGGTVRLSGRNGFGRVTVDLTDEGPASTRARLRMVYPLPFEPATPLLDLRWAIEAAGHLGERADVTLVPERIWPETAASCSERGTLDLSGSDVTPPALVRAVEPVYTAAARHRRFEGRVYLHLAIDASGAVACAMVASGLPYGLSDAALDAAQQWRFRPATRGGVPFAALVAVPIVFRVPSTSLPPPNTSGSVACGGTLTNDSASTCRDERPSSSTDAAGGS